MYFNSKFPSAFISTTVLDRTGSDRYTVQHYSIKTRYAFERSVSLSQIMNFLSSCLDSPEARNLRGIKLPLPCTSARELRKNMLKIKQSSPESWIIFRLFQRQISPHRAAVDLLAEIAQDRGPGHVLVRIAADLADHAICHPYLRSILMELISALHSFSSDTPHRWDFLFLFSLALGQIMTYGHEDLFNNDWSQDDLFDLKRDYISASAFCADVLNVVKHVRVGQEKTTSLDDAFDILRFAVEEEPSSPRKPVRHKNPDIDISAAATYMIHAGKVFFEASKRGSEECCITGKGGYDSPFPTLFKCYISRPCHFDFHYFHDLGTVFCHFSTFLTKIIIIQPRRTARSRNRNRLSWLPYSFVGRRMWYEPPAMAVLEIAIRATCRQSRTSAGDKTARPHGCPFHEGP